MKESFNYFDKIFCINLERRTDRWNNSLKQFKELGIDDKVIKFKAIEHVDGRIGCIRSHLEILKYAKQNNLNNILVLEDDVLFTKNDIIVNIDNATKQLPNDWELFYLGANLHMPLNPFSDNLFTINYAFSTHAIAYNNTIFDYFINNYSGLDCIRTQTDILDVWLATHVQPRNKSYLAYPLLAIQRNDYSDIERNLVDYSFIEQRYNTYAKK